MTAIRTGGCQCGSVRYAAEVPGDEAYLCHCRMCQRATGGVAAAFIQVRRAGVKWSGEPEWYQSSPIAQRPFCPACGTPFGFAYLDSDLMDLTIGSFDDPSGFRPTLHSGAEGLHEAWLDTSALPRMRSDEIESVVKHWNATGRKVPE